MRICHTYALRLLLVLLSTPLWAAPPVKTPTSRPATAPTFAQFIQSRITSQLNAIKTADDFAPARDRLAALFDQVIAYAPTADKDLEPWRDCAFALRLIDQ